MAGMPPTLSTSASSRTKKTVVILTFVLATLLVAVALASAGNPATESIVTLINNPNAVPT